MCVLGVYEKVMCLSLALARRAPRNLHSSGVHCILLKLLVSIKKIFLCTRASTALAAPPSLSRDLDRALRAPPREGPHFDRFHRQETCSAPKSIRAVLVV